MGAVDAHAQVPVIRGSLNCPRPPPFELPLFGGAMSTADPSDSLAPPPTPVVAGTRPPPSEPAPLRGPFPGSSPAPSAAADSEG